MMRPPLRIIPILAMVAMSTAACGEDFAPYNRLISPRVLALASDPPAPATGETTTFTPILYLPEGVAISSYEWSWCPFPGGASDGYPCMITEEELAEFGPAAASVPAFDLGTDPTATLENTLDPLLLGAICTGAPGQPPPVDCFMGFPAQIKLTITADDGTEITTIRRLLLRFDSTHEANALPEITGLAALIDGSEVDLDGSASVTIPRATETIIRAAMAEASSETYTDLDEEGEPVSAMERLTLSWFVESGDTNSGRTSFIDGFTEFADAIDNEWEPALVDDYPGETARIIVVLRDNRDGVAHAEASVTLGGAQ